MFKYIKEPKNTIHPQEKLHKNKVGYDYLQDNINYIIKSDTGTGIFYDIEPKKDIDVKDIKKFEKDYKIVFKTRAKEIDFSNRYFVNKHMMIMHKNLFGENMN
jgi:hypothetical protein